MTVRIVREAAEELGVAISHYEAIEPGLGTRLKEEVRGALAWVAKNPELPRVRSNGYRRVNLQVFPYYVAYFLWDETIWILAIAHGARRPEYWINRNPESSGED